MLDNSASPNVILPKDLQNDIDSARKNLSIMEGKVQILQSTNLGLNKDNNTLIKHQEYLKEEIAKLEEEAKKLKKEVAELIEQKKKETQTIDDKIKEFQEKASEIRALDSGFNLKSMDLTAKEEVLLSKEIQYQKDLVILEDEKQEFNSKVGKLKELLSIF